jgi:hypothetical protein
MLNLQATALTAQWALPTAWKIRPNQHPALFKVSMLPPCCVAADGAGAVFRLPGPFKHRPRLGSRLLVRNNLGASVAAMCSELSCWQSETRAMSARLLLVNLLLAEEGGAHHAQVRGPGVAHRPSFSVAVL